MLFLGSWLESLLARSSFVLYMTRSLRHRRRGVFVDPRHVLCFHLVSSTDTILLAIKTPQDRELRIGEGRTSRSEKPLPPHW